MKYYIAINQKYGIDTEDGLQAYIHDMLDKALAGFVLRGTIIV